MYKDLSYHSNPFFVCVWPYVFLTSNLATCGVVKMVASCWSWQGSDLEKKS